MPTILLVEDNEELRDTLVMLLQDMGYSTVVANDGAGGVQTFAEVRPDLVLTDIVMPDTDGIETIRSIRSIDPNARIIAMSGGSLISNDYYLRMAKALGAMAILTKPFEIDELVGLIERCLRDDPNPSTGGSG